APAGCGGARARGELVVAWCDQCGVYLQPSLSQCRVCGEPTRFRTVSGAGVLLSWISTDRAAMPGYAPTSVVGLVELVEQAGLRLATQVVDVPAGELCIGM